LQGKIIEPDQPAGTQNGDAVFFDELTKIAGAEAIPVSDLGEG